MTDAFTFNPDITFTLDNKLVLTGTADSSVSKIELFNSGTGADLGSAQISDDGAWSFTQDIDKNQSQNEFKAQVTDNSGKTTSVTDETLAITGITGNPFTSATENFTDTSNLPIKLYSDQGTLEYHGNFQQTGVDSTTFTETGDQVHTQFVFLQSSGSEDITQKITNFHVDGSSHDTLLLPHADFANMADLLRNTTMSGGNAVIHDPNNNATLTLMGVTKTEMKSHHSDFSFHGSGQL